MAVHNKLVRDNMRQIILDAGKGANYEDFKS